MLNSFQKSQIIDLKRKGVSTREISRRLEMSRETVSKYWNRARLRLHELEQKGEDSRTIQHELYLEPQYKARKTPRRTISEQTLKRLEELFEQDRRRRKEVGWDKQKLTNVQFCQILREEGYEISLCSVNIEMAKLRKPYKIPMAYIKQYYEYGKRLEFDFGEAKLDLGEGFKNYHMAVFCAPASNFRWCFLYDNQKQDVFLDSHVKFFKLIGGVWETVVYDNMRNVVSCFEGKRGKKLNEELQKLAEYYGYKISTTNPYAGNEKGSVERSVSVLRNRLFSLNQKFDSLETVRKYIDSELSKINKDSGIMTEKEYLSPAAPPYELADFSEGMVSKYGFVSIDGNRYSVPTDFVGKRVSVKKYYDEVRIFFDLAEIARHKRSLNKDCDIVDIMHFLKIFERKPGSVENSVALRAIPMLKELFDKHFRDNPRKFIEILRTSENIDTAVEAIKLCVKKQEISAKSVFRAKTSTDVKTMSMLEIYSKMGRAN